MTKKNLSLSFFTLAAFMLLLKPIIGFGLYNSTIENGSHEQLITVLKAFSKRKQEYQEEPLLSTFAIISEVSRDTPKPRAVSHFIDFASIFSISLDKGYQAFKVKFYPLTSFQKVYLLYQRFTL